MTPSAVTRKACRFRLRPAFTLVELLVVISIIMVLAGITVGYMSGAKGRQLKARARGEMEVIAASLEQYKAKNGDYPWVSGEDDVETGRQLYQALVGLRPRPNEMKLVSDTSRAKVFLDISKFSLSEADRPTGDMGGAVAADSQKAYLVDPWGYPYIYRYKNLSSPRSWENFGYVLISRGTGEWPQGKPPVRVPSDGLISESGQKLADEFPTILVHGGK